MIMSVLSYFYSLFSTWTPMDDPCRLGITVLFGHAYPHLHHSQSSLCNSSRPAALPHATPSQTHYASVLHAILTAFCRAPFGTLSPPTLSPSLPHFRAVFGSPVPLCRPIASPPTYSPHPPPVAPSASAPHPSPSPAFTSVGHPSQSVGHAAFFSPRRCACDWRCKPSSQRHGRQRRRGSPPYGALQKPHGSK
jgi:hypothetical protein